MVATKFIITVFITAITAQAFAHEESADEVFNKFASAEFEPEEVDKRAYNWMCPKACGIATGQYNKCRGERGVVNQNCLCNSAAFKQYAAQCKSTCSSAEFAKHGAYIQPGISKCGI